VYVFHLKPLIKNNPINRDVSFKLRCDGNALKPMRRFTSDFQERLYDNQEIWWRLVSIWHL